MEKVDDYRVVVITGKNDKSDDLDGEMRFVGPTSEYDFHIDCLLDYAKNRYPDVKVFQRMNDRFSPCVPIFFLAWLNSIVYINMSSERAGRCGTLYMPDEISEKQKEVLLELSKSFPQLNVNIVYNMYLDDDGSVKGTDFEFKKRQMFVDVLTDFFAQEEKKPKI